MEQALEIIRRRQVERMTALNRSTLYERIADGTFPKPIRLGTDARSVGWVASEVQAWIAARIAERDAKAATRGIR